MNPPDFDAAALNALSPGRFPGLIGFHVTESERGLVRARLDVSDQLLAPNGYLHAAVVIGLVDTACGLACEARLQHGGRTTQVWDARAYAEATDKTVALFRCTQLVLR